MGNTQTINKKSKKSELLSMINKIASKFILTQNFYDMKNLQNKQYCDKLVILTSKIIADKLDDLEITYLSQKLQKGNLVNKTVTSNVTFIEKEDLNKLDVKDTKTKFKRKQRMCIGIAKYYITIAHIFASIVKTINPTYSYKNQQNVKEIVDFFDKKKIPKNAVVKMTKNNICQNRINSLIGKHLKDVDMNQPTFCNINKGEKEKTLFDEPGIPELEKLYYDVFNYETGKFYKMSEQSKEQYNKDLETFYKAFTGKKINENVKSFQNIQLVDYNKLAKCKSGEFKKPYSKNDELFKSYGEHIANMMKTSNESQKKLIQILKSLFVESQDGSIAIHPLLDQKKLDSIVENTRNVIVNMYTNCEENFKTGLFMFEAIIEQQIKSNTVKKIENLQKTLKE
jgi:hypothetical protein